MTREPLTDMHPFWRGFWFGDARQGWKWGPITCVIRQRPGAAGLVLQPGPCDRRPGEGARSGSAEADRGDRALGSCGRAVT